MARLKWLAGLLGLILGVAGIIACFVGIVFTWSIRSQIDESVCQVSTRFDHFLVKAEAPANKVAETIEIAEKSMRRLNNRVQQRVSQLRDMPLEDAPKIDDLERKLYAKTKLVRNWIGTMQSIMDLIEQVVHMFQSAALFARQDDHTFSDLIAAIHAGKKEIQNASELLEAVRISLVEIRNNKNADKNAKRISTLSSKIDASLAKTLNHAESFQTAVAKARTICTDLSSKIRRQVLIAVILLTVVLIWTAIAQLSLAIHGWKALGLKKPTEANLSHNHPES